MTTLVGIVAGEKNERNVVLGSDMTSTQTSWNPQGDVAYRQQRRTDGQKIFMNKEGNVAICMTGVYDQPYIQFLSAFINGNFKLENSLKKGLFTELRDLNLGRWQGKFPHNDYINGLFVATRFNNDDPRLFSCYPLGAVEEKDWNNAGSGSEYVMNHISESKVLIPRGINVRQGIQLAVESLDKASQDLYTGGLDLVVVRKDKIYDLGKGIREKISEARSGGY